MDVHAVHLIAFTYLDGSAHLTQPVIKRGQFQLLAGMEINDHFIVLSGFDGLFFVHGFQLCQGNHRGNVRVDIQRFTGEPAQEAFENVKEPPSAGVDHTGLFQHRQQVWGVGYGPVSRFHRDGKQLEKIITFRQRRFYRVSGIFQHGQDRPFNRTNHAFVGGVFRFRQRPGKDLRGKGFIICHHAGKTAPQLGKDHAAVAAGAHQRSLCSSPHDLSRVVGVHQHDI